MSPASKSKSKDKSAAKAAVREQPKASPKPAAAPVNGGNGYNPLLGTFHSLETGPSTTLPPTQSNGRFHNIDETEDHSGTSLGTAAEFDSLSNNDSCSGESEDQQKEKTAAASSSRAEPVPGSDADKREKIRLKNEKKHQRQRERRALELHERCCSYLTSRKLESLAQKLVAMGFTSEQATMALIQNEGRVEESALWLLEGTEESKRLCASNVGGNPKIDIADELARIANLEVNFKCTKQEVERAVVACEGDLDRAEEALRTHKQESVVSPKLEESGEQPVVVSSNGFQNSRLATSIQNSTARIQAMGASPAAAVQLQRRDERDFNYTKSTAAGAGAQIETASRNLQPSSLRKAQMKSQAAVVPPEDKRWPITGSSPPKTNSRTPSALQVTAAAATEQIKPEARYVLTAGGEVNKTALLSGTTLREPIFMMQRPQSNGISRQAVVTPAATSGSLSAASAQVSNGWYHHNGSNDTNSLDMMKLAASGGLRQQLRSMNLSGSNSSHHQFYHQQKSQSLHQQQFISASSSPVESVAGLGWGGGSYSMMPGTANARMLSSSASPLSAPSPLGLFTGWGSPAPPVDWSTTHGSMPQCDYTSIDWSLEATPLPLPASSSSIKAERLYDNSWYSKAAAARPAIVNGQEGSLMVEHPAPVSAAGHEWTSPFAGKDLFRAPRQYVTSPSP